MAVGFQFHIDHPKCWDDLPQRLLVRGWCFATDVGPIIGIRLKLPDRVASGFTGLLRPDVRAAVPQAPNDFTGFEIRASLPAGEYAISIDVLLPDDTWHPLAEHKISVRRDLLPFWLQQRSAADLIPFQMPTQAVHAPRSLKPDRYPRGSVRFAPCLSIVTPSYQQAAFLEETIRSVLHDAPAGLHYVVQDGGSTDGSPEIIARCARNYPEVGDGRPPRGIHQAQSAASTIQPPASGLQPSTKANGTFAWSSEADRGQGDAIAKGFAKTSGGPEDVMAWINSDDFYLPGALRFVAGYFARNPKVDVVYGHRILVDENSREIGRWFLPKHNPEVLRLNDFVPQETLFWRRRIWDRVGGIDASFTFAMDWDLLLRFQVAGAKIVRVPYFLACFRIHAAQKTSAQIHSVGQAEIDRLRERTFGRPIPPTEIESHPALIRYLRKSAFIESLWKLGIRAP